MATLSPGSASEGPSIGDWEFHKAEIIELYKTLRLRDVRALMQSKYGFSATKRMYDTRFRRWEVSKVMKSAEKDRMAQEIARVRASDEESGMVMISDKKLKKIIRHVQMQARRGRVAPTTQKNRRRSKRSGVDTNKTSPPSLKCESTPGSAVDINRANSCFDNAVTPMNDDWIMLDPNSAFDLSLINEASTSESSSTEYTGSSRSSLSVSPVPIPLRMSADRMKELVLYNVRSFYCSSVETTLQYPPSFDILSLGSSAASKAFWTNVKDGIYLAKIGGTFTDIFCRSQQALLEAESVADDAIVSAPFDFCRELLSTLSPTNVPTAQSAIRQQVLASINTKATLRLGANHPIAMLSNALSQDGDRPDVSLSGLDLLLGFFRTYPDLYKTALYKMTETIIAFMRRAGQLDDARSYASNALDFAKLDCGEHSVQARKIAVQLAHVLTSLGDYGRTLPLRLYVVQQPISDQRPSIGSERPAASYLSDSTAIHAMEDLAEYYVRFGNLQEGKAWLLRAEKMALEVWGDIVSTRHISDKLVNLFVGITDGQVVDGKILVAA